jgi:uncharacterized protein YigE (DUF2233 family)
MPSFRASWRPIAACLVWLAMAALPAAADSCRQEVFEGARHVVCAADPALSDIRVFWRNGDGAPYRTFAALADDLAAGNLDLAFAMNGGMFGTDYSPIGLLIVDGMELRPANTADGPAGVRPVPNFYKKPNGVFYIGPDGRAGVVETGRFLRDRPPAEYATQSGPLLVIDGKIHPAFIIGSSDRRRRAGVGVCDANDVRFAISEDAVNFHDFARFFRDHLGCPNALYLDGGAGSGLHAPELSRSDWPGHGGYGPMIGVVRPGAQ